MKALVSLLIIYTGFVIAYFINGYLAQHLQLEGLGDYSTALSIASISASIVVLGGQAAARRFLPQYIKDKKFSETKGYVNYFLKNILLLSALFIVAALLISVALKYFGLDHLRHEALLATSLIPLIAMSTFAGSIIQSMHKFYAAIIPHQVIRPVLFLSGCATWIYFLDSFNEYEAIALNFAAMSITIMVQLFLMYRAIPFQMSTINPIYFKVEWHKVSIPLFYSTLANSFLIRMDILALELFHVNESEVGVFVLLIFIASMVWINFAATANVISPRISQYDNDKKGLQKLFSQSLLFMICGNIISASIIVIFADEILAWFHGDMASYKDWLYVVVIGASVNSVLEVASPFLRFGGLQNKSAKIATFTIIINLIFMPLGVMFYGMEGAIIVLVSTRFIRGLGYMICLSRESGLKFFPAFGAAE
ncbi:MAG: hypothetical protein GY784_07655 [Gammaproteobacteria bacterium]|nr:hypothetical protein [Gammaproteobacteria bacterium]